MKVKEKGRLEKIKMIARIAKINMKSSTFIGAIIGVATAIALYYILMPAWIIVVVVREGEDVNALPDIENRFEITQSDLAELPKLRGAMAEADGNYPYEHWIPPTKAWYWEGTQILERFDMDSQYPPEYEAMLMYNDNNNMKKAYHIQVVFGYDQQGQL